MKDRIKTSIVILLLIWILLYLGFFFAVWDFNPKIGDIAGSMFLALICLICLAPCVFYIKEE